MPWVSEEQIQELKQIRAYEYLRKNQPNRLKKTRTVNEWELTDHDSFKINEVTSKWHWKSRDIGGISALRFLTQVDGFSFMEAVNLLQEGNFVYIPQDIPAAEKKPFVLPEKNMNNRRILQYLSGRGISEDVIRYCLRLGILYESSPYHNAVFVGRDENGKARYAFLPEKNLLKSSRQEVKKRMRFVCLPKRNQSGLRFTKPALTHWPI